MNVRNFSVARVITIAALTTSIGAVSVFGQEVAEEEASGDVITMSVFSVDASQDQGYRATN